MYSRPEISPKFLILTGLTFAVSLIVYGPITFGFFAIDDMSVLNSGAGGHVETYYLSGRYISAIAVWCLNSLFGNYVALGHVLKIIHLASFSLFTTYYISALLGEEAEPEASLKSQAVLLLATIAAVLFPIFIDALSFITTAPIMFMGFLILFLFAHSSVRGNHRWLAVAFPLLAMIYQVFALFAVVVAASFALARLERKADFRGFFHEVARIVFFFVLGALLYFVAYRLLESSEAREFFGFSGELNARMTITNVPMARLEQYLSYLFGHLVGNIDQYSVYRDYGALTRMTAYLVVGSGVLFALDAFLRKEWQGQVVAARLVCAAAMTAMTFLLLGNPFGILFNSWYAGWREISLTGIAVAAMLMLVASRVHLRWFRYVLVAAIACYATTNALVSSKLVFQTVSVEEFETSLATRILGRLDTEISAHEGSRPVYLVGALKQRHPSEFLSSSVYPYGVVWPKLSIDWSKANFLMYLAGYQIPFAQPPEGLKPCPEQAPGAESYVVVGNDSYIAICLY